MRDTTRKDVPEPMGMTNDKPMRERNQVEELEMQKEKLQAIIKEQEVELLSLYRRLLNREY